MTSLFHWRPLSHLDIPALAELLAAAEREDATREHFDETDLAEEFDDDSLDLARDSVAVFDGPALLGMGLVRVRVRGMVDGNCVMELWGTVRPERRGEGIGRGILAFQLHRAGVIHAERYPGVSARLVVRPYDHNRSHVELVQAAGLVPLRHWFDMQRDLTLPLPELPSVDPVIEIVPYDDVRDEEVRRAYNAAFAGSFGAVEQDGESWSQWFTGSRAFRPELSALAVHEDRVVGFLLSYFYEADAVQDGVEECWIGQVGTLPGHRRQGIGTHLIARALHAYRAAGFNRAALDVDSESAIGGLAIYSRLGFTVDRKRTSFARLLPPVSRTDGP